MGNAMPLSAVPLGSSVHCVELYAGRGGQLVRTAGASAQVMAKEGDYVALKLPSTEVRLVRRECYATLGEVGNAEVRNTSLGKAGRRRWLGRRPQVRGSVMNPCDHPHGGGEGRAPIGRSGPVPHGANPPWVSKPASGTSPATNTCSGSVARPPSGAVAVAIPDDNHRFAACLNRYGTFTQKRPVHCRQPA